MKKSQKNTTIIYLFSVIIIAAILRIIPHPPNIIPITALSLFSGAMIHRKVGFLIPLSAMLLSDIFLGFHSVVPYVYGSFVLITFIGRSLLQEKKGLLRIFSASLSSSVLFFIITNFGVWVTSGMYIKDVNGLMNSYIMGLPFFKNTVFGDLFYSFSLFYGYELSLLLGKKLAVYFKR